MKLRLTLLGLACLCGCARSVPGSGILKTESPPVAGAKVVNLSGVGELHITQGPTESLNVTTDDNLLPLLDTRLEGDILTLGQKSSENLQPTRGIVDKLSLKEVSSLTLSGAGTVDASGLRRKDLTVVASGAGEMHLNELHVELLSLTLSGAGRIVADGYARQQALDSSGVGSFEGKGLEGDAVTVSISGAGSTTVNATKTLDANVSGTGSVTYFGKPTVSKKVTGVGNINPG